MSGFKDHQEVRVEAVGDPDLTWVGVHGRALKEHRGGAVAQRPIHHIAVSRDPANVRHTAEHVALPVVKDVLVKSQDAQIVTERKKESITTINTTDPFGCF